MTKICDRCNGIIGGGGGRIFRHFCTCPRRPKMKTINCPHVPKGTKVFYCKLCKNNMKNKSECEFCHCKKDPVFTMCLECFREMENKPTPKEEWSDDENLLMVLAETGVKEGKDFQRIFKVIRQLLKEQKSKVIEEIVKIRNATKNKGEKLLCDYIINSLNK
jgi:hypothetical protein